jgi:FlaA1/EpsC-like NDP-sugar epimerase
LPTNNARNRIVSGKTILVTGAGGSIGSALAKAIIPLEPRRLILLDSSERNLNEIDLDLAAKVDCNLCAPVL